MIKYKKWMSILVIFLLGAVFLAGCSTGSSDSRTVTATGTLAAVDAAAGTITVAAENSGEIELKVDDQSEIKIGQSPVTLAQLADKIDTVIKVVYDADTKILISAELEAEEPDSEENGSQEGQVDETATAATGTLKAVSSAADTVTIATESGELELKVNAQTEINIGASPATLMDLADKGDIKVRIEYDDQTKVLKAISLDA